MTKRKQTLIARIKAQTVEEGNCWVWAGYAVNNLPLTHYRIPGKDKSQCMGVRRAILHEQGRPFRKYEQVRTSCGNPLCVNPDHIKVVDVRAHMRLIGGKASEGPRNIVRSAKIAATRRATAKLTLEQVAEIRERTESAPTIAPLYGVSSAYINRIRAGRCWRDFTNPFLLLAA